MINVGGFFKVYFLLLAQAYQVLISLLIAIVLLGYTISIVEGKSFWEAQYFAFITALTIGYGDITPHTPLGKFISILLGISGMVFSGILIAAAIKSLEAIALASIKKEESYGKGGTKENS